MSTPYVTPAMLTNAPTGVSWQIIPSPRATADAQLAEQTNICWRATSMVDTICNQVLRATVDNEYLLGPGEPRVGVDRATGNTRLVMRRWPVTDVLGVQVAANTFPRVWSSVPAGLYEPERPLLNAFTDSAAATAPDGGSSILLAPGYVDWCRGRAGYRVLVSYVNGWPHSSLTAPAQVGDLTVEVDDVTGFTGAVTVAYDGAATEQVAVASVAATRSVPLPNGAGTAQTGPGVLTLASPLTKAHAAGVVVSALPGNVIWATVLAAAAQALESGIVSVTIQNVSGKEASTDTSIEDMRKQVAALLNGYGRVI